MKRDVKTVIDQFLESLNQRNMAACQKLLREIAGDKTMRHVYDYFDAILSEVVDQDWGTLQSLCQELIQGQNVHPYLKGQAAISLGIAYNHQAMWSDALAASAQAEQIFRTLDDPIETAKALKQTSIIYHEGYRQGDFARQELFLACNACRESVEILEHLPPQTTRNRSSSDGLIDFKAAAWNSLGMVYNSLSEFHDAEQAFLKALNYTAETGNQFLSALFHDSLGETYYMAKQFEQAEVQYVKAFEILQMLGQDATNESLDIITNLAVLMQALARYEEALSYYQQAINLIERMRKSNDSIEVRAGFAATVAHIYANAILTCIDSDNSEKAFEYMQQARSRAFLDMLRTEDTQRNDAPVSARTLTLVEVQERLPDDVLLLEYFTTGLIKSTNSREYENRPGFPASRTFIFAITSSEIEIYEVPMAPNDFLPRDLHGVVENHFLEPEVQQILYQVLIQPILPWTKEMRTIYLVPHGPLHYVPFQALLTQEPQFWFASDDAPQLIYTPSSTILCSALNSSTCSIVSSQLNQKKSASCLAVGFNGKNSDRNLSSVKGSDIQLGFAESEASAIANLTKGRVLIGSVPKKADFLAIAANYQCLHISCHGYFNPEAPLHSTLHFADNEDLTAQEVLDRLTITCDLVILSACETGLSLVQRGDELFGLVRAFLSAGTKAMIVTQWRVDEGSTTILMERFYTYLQSGQPISDALRQARNDLMEMTCAEVIQILENYKEFPQNTTQARQERIDLYIQRFSQKPYDEKIFADPYYWAPFILISQELA